MIHEPAMHDSLHCLGFHVPFVICLQAGGGGRLGHAVSRQVKGSRRKGGARSPWHEQANAGSLWDSPVSSGANTSVRIDMYLGIDSGETR